jgi:phosphate transport system substrate-binding protein
MSHIAEPPAPRAAPSRVPSVGNTTTRAGGIPLLVRRALPWRVLAALAVTGGLALTAAAPASAANSTALIQGSGSSWSANAINQWIADVQSNGLQVVYTASGSAQGRKDFAYRTNDFAVSDIGYQGTDPVTGQSDTSDGRAYAYLPIVAGGTAFPYQIKVGGQLVRNLRLSGETLAKIFTNQITNWDDPEITADNNGRRLPSLTVIPVVHSEGSGTSAMFSEYLDTMFPSIWRPYFGGSGMTEYYPRKGGMIAQNGSDGVMNFVSQASANGAIGMDEYSYALAENYPVAKLENANGYFTLPTQYNVAVALTQALINYDKSSPDYLLQTLNKVYVDADPRTYPLSSYSYMIIPTSPTDPRMTTAKRQTLADFLYYSICQGQQEMGPIGYSPLPINLVSAGFEQTALLKTADPGVDLSQQDVSTCHNPTFIAGQPTRNYLAEIAPYPPSCDKAGQGPCTGGGDPGTHNPPPSGSAAGTRAQATVAASAKTASTTAAKTVVSVPAASSGTTTNASQAQAQAYPVDLAAPRTQTATGWLGPLCVLLLLAALVAPPLLSLHLERRRVGEP